MHKMEEYRWFKRMGEYVEYADQKGKWPYNYNEELLQALALVAVAEALHRLAEAVESSQSSSPTSKA